MTTENEFQVSHTKLATFRRCKQQYYWKYLKKYFPKPSIGQSRGSAGHAALAVWHKDYNVKTALDAAWTKWYGDGFDDSDEWQLLQKALNNYFAWSYKNDSFILEESEFKFTLQFETEPVITLVGYVDGILSDANRFWLLENKFQKRASVRNLDMDAQVTLYLMAMSNLRNDIDGVLYNAVRIGDTKIAVKEPCLRSKIYRSKNGFNTVAGEIVAQALEMVRFEQEEQAPYRNPTRDCSWDCPFYSVCLSMLDDGIESEELLRASCNNNDEEQGE